MQAELRGCYSQLAAAQQQGAAATQQVHADQLARQQAEQRLAVAQQELDRWVELHLPRSPDGWMLLAATDPSAKAWTQCNF